MHAAVTRLTVAARAIIRRFPWLGWVAWLIFCAIALARTAPHRYGATFAVYLDAARRLLAHQQVYDPDALGGYLYLPVSLIVYAPFTSINPDLAAALWQIVFAAVFTWGCYLLVLQVLPEPKSLASWPLAGMVLLINVPAAWYNFKGVQAQTILAGAMLIAGVAIMRTQWLRASFWLFVALVFKPLALVMVLLCGALCPRMRLPLIIGVAAAVALPFAFLESGYVQDLYRDYGLQLWRISSVPPHEWPYRADIATLLEAFGVVLPGAVSLGLRLLAAVGTLYLAWRVCRTGTQRSFGFALVTLSACYINLFSPRNEFLSFLVLTPSLAVLSFLLLERDDGDWRGWLLIAAALVLGLRWNLAFDAVAKPAIVIVVFGWLAWLMVKPERWRELTESASRERPLNLDRSG